MWYVVWLVGLGLACGLAILAGVTWEFHRPDQEQDKQGEAG